MEHPQVSIIIPAYNRADLIPETLDSIRSQTFRDWECLVADDGSTDGTLALLERYAAEDMRFRIFRRPAERAKGANACRNIGLENAKGKYVIFFDSDDLMTQDHIEVKVRAISSSGADYVIARTRFFNSEKSLAYNYQFKGSAFTAYDYVSQNINWLTYDTCIKAGLAKKVRFNEKLHSGQEYNYFCKLVHISVDAKIIGEVLTLRRRHESSIRGLLEKDPEKKMREKMRAHWLTYLDIRKVAEARTRRLLLLRLAKMQYGIAVSKIFRVGRRLKKRLYSRWFQ